MANMFINAMTDIWTSGGTTYNAIKMTVTDSASAAGSKLISLIGGSTGTTNLFSVDKSGNVAAAGTISTTGAILPAVDDGAALGSTTYKWSDLYLANGSTINWGTALTATHVSPNQLTFTVTDNGAIGPLLKTVHNTASPLAAISTSNGGSGYADGDEVVRAEFWGKNASGTDTCWGTFRGNIWNATAGSERMQWFFNTNYQGVIDDVRGRISWDHRHIGFDFYDDTSVAGPILYLTRNSASAAANDLIGFIGFVGHNNAATPLQKAYGEFGMRILDPTSTLEDGEYYWKAYVAGVQTELFKLSGASTGATFAVPVITAASTATITGFNLPHGVAPTSPVNGDVWTTTTGLFARISSATVGPFASVASPSLTTPSMSNVTITGATNTATGATWTNLGTVTTADIDGGTIDGAVIGGAIAVAGTFTTLTGTTVVANTAANPDADDGAALGTTLLGWSDLYLASTATLNFGNTNWVATHTSGILTVGTGDLRITTAGTNAASVVTVGGTQTLTAKTLTSPTIATILTNAGAATLTLPTTTDTLVGKATTDTLTTKTINLTSNTLSGTIAQFNTALSDADFATLAGSEALSNKTITASPISGSTGSFTTLGASGAVTFGAGGTLTGTFTGGTYASTTLTTPIIDQINPSSTTFIVQASDDGAAIGPNLILKRVSASPNSSDVIGGVTFRARDSTAADHDYVLLKATISDAANTFEDGLFDIQTSVNGTLGNRISISNAGNTTISGTTTLSDVAISSGAITAGTYTPTLTNVANVAASTMALCNYIRVGDTVMVTGNIAVDPTATGDTLFELTLPIASNFAAVTDASGTIGGNVGYGYIDADVANNRVNCNLTTSSATNQQVAFTFSYRII